MKKNKPARDRLALLRTAIRNLTPVELEDAMGGGVRSGCGDTGVTNCQYTAKTI